MYVRHTWIGAVVVATVLAIGAGSMPQSAAASSADTRWVKRLAAGRTAATQRTGSIGFAVVDNRGVVVGGYRMHATFASASVFKSMLLICFLNDPQVRNRKLTTWEQSQLKAMITRSSDEPANWLYGRVNHRCLQRIADNTGMGETFHTESVWGRTTITPYGVARMFWNIDRRIVERHRPRAMRWLRGVVPEQRWGLPKVAPHGMTIAFKGGFAGSPGGGRTVSQGALFTAPNGHRIAVAILTNHSPSQGYGETTLERVGRKLLSSYDAVPPAR